MILYPKHISNFLECACTKKQTTDSWPFLFLIKWLTISSGSPVFTVEPMDTVVDSGSTVVINCQAQGEPTPVIEWARQGRPLLANDRITTLSNGSLRLSSAQKEDTSNYECVARNLLGSAIVHVALTVRGKIALIVHS